MSRRAVVIWTLLSLAAVLAALSRLTIDPVASAEGGRANLVALWPLWITSGLLWAGLTGIWITLRRQPPAPAGAGGAAAFIIAVAVTARLVVLIGHEVALSDDIHRYAFDGRNSVRGVNPYRVRPQERLDPELEPRWPGELELARRVNHPQMHTIYLPVSQIVFAAMARLVPVASSIDAHVLTLRCVMVCFELATILLLLMHVRRAGRSPWWVALYAWHPLGLTEIAGSGHQESIGALLLVVSLIVATSRPKSVIGWTIPLAVAALVKPFVIPIAGVLLRGRRPGRWFASAIVGAMVVAGLSIPFLTGAPGEVLENIRATSTRFTLKWAHFGSVYEPLLKAIEQVTPEWTNDPQEQLARGLCALIAVAAVTLIIMRRREPWSGARMILLAMILLSPVVHPWYLLWALVLMPVAPSPALWIASLTLPWGYVAWRYGVDEQGQLGWFVPPTVMFAAYAPIYVAAAWPGKRTTESA